MFLLSLEVQNFRALHDVRLKFGRGLNVLFGPNDVGKSSLAEALRVAFLLPVTSAACSNLVPWGTDFAPRVLVNFEMKDVVWQITKTFGAGVKGSALLERVGEKGSLFEEARGRDVEGRLREIIAWGVPAPGGKGAPRGLPENYLSTTLLGLQHEVTAILAASPGPVNSGLELVTKALYAHGQEPLVGLLLQRLQERTEKVFTEDGRFRRAEDSPLVQLTNKVTDQKDRLDKLEELVRRSGEIEKKVQSLTEQRILADEVCTRLERRAGLLRKVSKAEEELEGVRDREQSIQEARRVLGGAEKDLGEIELKHEKATSAFLNVENYVRTARECLAKILGGRDKVRENAQHTRNARRAELIAKRDAAAGRGQSARDVIQAWEQVQFRERELALAERAHQQAQQAELCAHNLAKLAALLAEQERAKAVDKDMKVARKERDDRATQVTAAETELQKAQANLENAEVAVKSQTDALATAQREADRRDLSKDSLRATLKRTKTDEQMSEDAVDRANFAFGRIERVAIGWSERLAEAEKSLTNLKVVESGLEGTLTANSAEKQTCEARRRAKKPLPIRAALMAGLLGVAATAALGILLKVDLRVLVFAIVGCGFLAAAVTAVALHQWKLRETELAERQELDNLARAGEILLARRNQVEAEYKMAQERVDSARIERDQAEAALEDHKVALERAERRREEARRERESILRELAILEGQQPKNDSITSAHIEAAKQAVLHLKEQIFEKRRIREGVCRRRDEAQVRFEAGTSAAASVDLAGLEQRVNAARLKTGGEVAPAPKEALTRFQRARQTAAECETGMKVATGRLSDARSSFEGMAGTLEQPADQVLAEAEKKCEDADKDLKGLEETFSTEVVAAEKEFLEAQADVDRLSKEQTTARTEAEAATLLRDQARTKHEQARATYDALLAYIPNASLTDAEAGLAQARRELELDPGGPISSPENLAAVEALLEQQQAELRRTENELQEARGQLKLVGGTVLRDQRDQEFEALEGLKKLAGELELYYSATKHLLDVLKEEEGKHAAHLGQSLAKPVTELFSEFTSGRYAQIVLDSGLRFQSVMAKGGERDLASLSVGTRDQLATLVRLALAAHLKSVLVLDDQLAHSDSQRLVWFRERLRASVRDHDHQVIVITCRPLDYLHPEEIPASPCDRLVTEDERLAVVDLERLLSGEKVASCSNEALPQIEKK